jgi:hypothetical protein
MTLVFDQRGELSQGPGLHALIAGVSAYRHLPGGAGPIARRTFGFSQRHTAARTAFRIRTWLEERRERLPVPLATIRC